MAAPTALTIVQFPGTEGGKASDEGACCGPISSTPLAPGDLTSVINYPPSETEDTTYYGGLYIKNTSSGKYDNARVFNRCAALVNPVQGIIGFTTDRAGDAGKKIFVWGKVSGLIAFEYVTLVDNGTVYTTKTYDAESVVFYEAVNASLQSVSLVSVVTISQLGIVLSVMRGTGGNPAGIDLSVIQVYTFLNLALLGTKNADLLIDNRKTVPTDIAEEDFATAHRWAGTDAALPVPTNFLGANQSIGVGLRLIMPANFPTPHAGYIQRNINSIGSALVA